MSEVFISYAREDRPKAQLLAALLQEQGWSVWWDREIYAGTEFDDAIEEALDSAQCVVVLWSRHSVSSDWVKTEADDAANREILVPALLEDVRVPLRFRRIQAAKLVDWQGGWAHSGVEELVRGVTRKLGGSRVTVAAAGSKTVAGDIIPLAREDEFAEEPPLSGPPKPPPAPVPPRSPLEKTRTMRTTVIALAGAVAVATVALVVAMFVNDGETGSTSSGSYTSTTVLAVPGTSVWTDTGIDLKAGDQVSIQAWGHVIHSNEERLGCDPDGDPDKLYPSNVILDVGHCALLGRIGSHGAPLKVGKRADFTAAGDGRLYLGVNDVGVDNNDGEFRAEVRVRQAAA